MIFLGILIAIIVFSIIIIIHELGHFLAARKFGVKVEEFGLGIPPKAKELFTDKKGTTYTLNWLPLGGFVRLKGENHHSLVDKNDTETFSNKTYLAQTIIILGGVFMNFLLAIIIFSILFFVGVKPLIINSKIETTISSKIIPTQVEAIKSGFLKKGKGVLLYPLSGSIAETAGINSGDVLLEINGREINSPQELMLKIGNSKNKQLELFIHQQTTCAESNECLSIIPNTIQITPDSNGKIGTYISENISINDDFEYKYGLFDSIKYGTIETYSQSVLTLKGLGIIVKNIILPDTPSERSEAISNMRGPIGIGDLIANTFDRGIVFLMILSAIISINLGIFNLLPIPALDGGRFFFISINKILESLFGQKGLIQNIENLVHIFFFIILIVLSVLIGYNDIVNIISR